MGPVWVQVCGLEWSANVNQLISTHGYSRNHLDVWTAPGTHAMHRLASLSGHTARVCCMALSPDGCTVVTGSGDETLRFWAVLPAAPRRTPLTSLHQRGFLRSSIR